MFCYPDSQIFHNDRPRGMIYNGLMEINEIIRDRRHQMGLTMKQVSAMVGVSESTISRWESGNIENMRRNHIAALAKALQLSPAVIMGWEDYVPETHSS